MYSSHQNIFSEKDRTMAYNDKQKPAFPPKPKGPLDNDKITLYTPVPGQPGKKSRLIWGMFQNNPRVIVYTNNEANSSKENDFGKITAALDAPVFFGLLELLESLTEKPNDTKFKIENKNYTWFGGRRSETPVLVSELWVGKDKEGAMWISVTASGRPKIVFYFEFSDYHFFLHGDGTPMSKQEGSVVACRSYCKLLRGMYENLLVTSYVDPNIAKAAKEAAQSGGGNRGGYSPQQSSAPVSSDSFDDDAPY